MDDLPFNPDCLLAQDPKNMVDTTCCATGEDGHFNQIIMKLRQNVCHYEFLALVILGHTLGH